MDNKNTGHANTLFLALTRPSMMMGVTMEAFFINIIIAICTFIIAKNIFFALIWLPLHLICIVLCRMDTQLFSIILCKTRLAKPNNAALWKGASYEPY
jgi:type IV secretion system protein VirB3